MLGDMRFVVLAAAAAGLLQPDGRCLPCHAKQVKSFTRTPMARSVSAPVSQRGATRTQITHDYSRTTLRVIERSNTVIHEAVRGGRRAAYAPAFAIGSGNQGSSFAVALQDAFFQSPISWYTRRAAFDLSPGYETDSSPDFFRPITPDCLFCHAGASRPRRGTQNRYIGAPSPPAPIGCDRCHGDPARHLSRPVRTTIVNPARLEPDRRDAVCEQCHLSGEARIPSPRMEFSDFRPGMRMEDVFSVYVGHASGDSRGLKVVSHSEQMALSRCFIGSGRKLWCGSCHDPHSEPENKTGWYREKCLGCHSDETTAAHRIKAGDSCAGCHMPQVRPYDGGHTAFTDHRIGTGGRDAARGGSTRLRAWREPAATLQNRNLGLAYVSAASKSGDMSQLRQGFNLLGSEPADGAVETARGLILLRINKSAEAAAVFRRAVAEEPEDSTRRYNLAVALLASGDKAGAMEEVERAIALEPLLEDAWALAAEIQPHRAAWWKQRYLRLVPQRLLP
jgi:hypothetical protein